MSEHGQNDVTHYRVRFDDLTIDRGVIERALGYAEEGANELVRDAIDDTLALFPAHADIRCGFRIIGPERLLLSNTTIAYDALVFNSGPIITKRLKKSTALALFVATAGPDVDRWSRELMAEGDMLKGYVVDTLGSETAEQAAEWLEKRVGDTVAPRGWKITNRYSPGYCEWGVAEQHKLFSLLPEAFCGIRLTDSALMLPIKSVSGIIGLGSGVKREDYQCSICDLKDCIRRRVDPVPAPL